MIAIRQMLESVKRDERWPAVLDAQEELLRPKTFNCDDALRVGTEIVRRAKALEKSMAIQIELHGFVAFQYHMDGTSRFHDWFIAQKANVVRETGVSSMRAFLNCVFGGQYRDAPWFDHDGNYVLCGGSIPLVLQNGAHVGILTVSGGSHEEDHQLAAEGLAALLGHPKIPSILE